MKVFSSKRWVVTAAVVILLVLFLVRPGVSRLKARITNSISRAVARPATRSLAASKGEANASTEKGPW